jgi:hypothetical protein
MASLVGGPLFLKLLGNRLPFKAVPAEFANLEVRKKRPCRRSAPRCLRFAADRSDAGEKPSPS